MRRYIKAICVFLCLLFVLVPSGCETNDDPSATAAEIANNLKAFSSEDITWVEIGSNELSSYFGFDSDLVDEFKGYINDNEDAYDIIAVFKSENRQEVIKGINLLIAGQETTYKVASENLYAKVNNKIIAERDDLVILCIVDGYEQANKYLTENLEAKIIS